MHLTLKFLGDIDINKIDGIRQCMEKAARGVPRFSLSAFGIGAFPSIKNTRIIWAGTRGQTDMLANLVHRLEKNLFKDLNIPTDKKPYFPHLTVARLKKPVFPKKMIKLSETFKNCHSKNFLTNDIILFQSELKSSGAVHKKLFSVPLK